MAWNPYISFGSVILFVALRQFTPHGGETEFGEALLGSVILERLLIQPYHFAVPKRVHISVLVFGTLDPAGITASLRFQFQKSVNIGDEITPSPVSGSYCVT